ncbi:MAG: hypothetical protein H6754_04970 [Candidatus Omnitrophica bacterium]|nr:hypothetical protein [Candidatus Omnitrophota bacterium]
MRIYIHICVGLILQSCLATQSQAAFVSYRDDSGKLHYVNTDYRKVPDQYKDQIKGQIEEPSETQQTGESPNNQFGVTMTFPRAKASSSNNQASQNEPITHEDRFNRLLIAIDTLHKRNILPSYVNINEGAVYYEDNEGKNHYVTAENFADIPEEYLPQIDTQITAFENLARQSEKEMPLISGTTNVEVFTKLNCRECVRLQTLLQVHKISFITYDVEQSTQGKDFYKSMNNAALPLTRVGQTIIAGNNISDIKKALDMNATQQQFPNTNLTEKPTTTDYQTNPKMEYTPGQHFKIQPLLGQKQ